MKFDIITIFPEVFGAYFNESILKRAQEKKLIEIKTHNLRDYTEDKHKTVDDKPFGGGAGMVMKIEPIYKAVQDVLSCSVIARRVLPTWQSRDCHASPAGFARNDKVEVQDDRGQKGSTALKGLWNQQVEVIKNQKSNLKNKEKELKKQKIILLSAKGKRFDQKMARQLAKLDQIIFICGRYEGVDERVAKKIADMEVSVGDYVLTGGELPAMIIVDAVARLVPEVIKKESLQEESYGKDGVLEYPQYTRPEDFMGWKVPKVLLSGHHKKVEEWKKNKSKIKNQKSKIES